ncbi:MAG TPA: RNA polymerase sigma factor, partial [Acidobacteriota bacterium]|nr:RNA polymerase sigma factor [Acidobacteriota bacterium]
MQPEINDLVLEAQNGSRTALESVVAYAQKYVYNLALRMLQHPMDAEDATQEILIKLITHLGQFRGESSFSTWMYRVALNVAISHLRHNNRSALRPLSIDSDEASGIAAPEPIQPDERITELNRQIQQLEPLNRALLLLYLEERLLPAPAPEELG